MRQVFENTHLAEAGRSVMLRDMRQIFSINISFQMQDH